MPLIPNTIHVRGPTRHPQGNPELGPGEARRAGAVQLALARLAIPRLRLAAAALLAAAERVLLHAAGAEAADRGQDTRRRGGWPRRELCAAGGGAAGRRECGCG